MEVKRLIFKINIFGIIGGNFYFCKKVKKKFPMDENKILLLLQSGLNSQEISERLNLDKLDY